MGLQGILRKLNSPNSFVHGVASTAAIAGLALVDPRKLTTGSRLAYRGAVAGLSAWIMHASLRPINEDFDLIGPVGRAAITTGSAGTAFGFTEVGEALDARLHDKIKRAGARRPRLWLAAGEGAVAATAWWLGRRIDNAADANVEEFGKFGAEAPARTMPVRTLHEVPDDLWAIMTAMLEATDEFGSPQLREQLAASSVYHWNGAEPDFNAGQFHVPNPIPGLCPATIGSRSLANSPLLGISPLPSSSLLMMDTSAAFTLKALMIGPTSSSYAGIASVRTSPSATSFHLPMMLSCSSKPTPATNPCSEGFPRSGR